MKGTPDWAACARASPATPGLPDAEEGPVVPLPLMACASRTKGGTGGAAAHDHANAVGAADADGGAGVLVDHSAPGGEAADENVDTSGARHERHAVRCGIKDASCWRHGEFSGLLVELSTFRAIVGGVWVFRLRRRVGAGWRIWAGALRAAGSATAVD